MKTCCETGKLVEEMTAVERLACGHDHCIGVKEVEKSMPRKIRIDTSTDKHFSTHTFYVDENNVLTDVYISGKPKKGMGGFADFVDVKYIDKDVIRMFEVQLALDELAEQAQELNLY